MTEDQVSGQSQQVVRQALSGSGFTVAAQGVTTTFGLVRSIILARLLAPEQFGILALALFYVSLIANLSAFGLGVALVQKKEELKEALPTYFVLRTSLAIAGFLVTVALVPILAIVHDGRPALLDIIMPLAAAELIQATSSTPLTLLYRRLAFKRIAMINVISSISMTIVAPILAYLGWGIWSLVVGEQLIGVLVTFVAVWFWRPPWHLSFQIDWQLARQYLGFGKYVTISGQLTYLLDRFDDFWTGAILGNAALGYYSKAYEYARYPRRVISSPLNSVLFVGYTRLQDDLPTLTDFFFRSASLMFRANSLFSLALFMVVPDFTLLVLGEKWLPMVNVFRLLVIYSLLDPLFVISSHLTTALGEPEVLTRIKLVQLAVFVPAVMFLGQLWQIEGVALAADLMLLVGMGAVFRAVRRLLPVSTGRILWPPLIAALSSGLLTTILAQQLLVELSLWLQMFLKGGIAVVMAGVILFLLERREMMQNFALLRHYLSSRHVT